MSAQPASGNRNRIIIIVVVVVLLCCCCIAVAGGYYFYTNGDKLMNSFPTPAAPASALLRLIA